MTLKQQKIDFAKNSLDSIFDDTRLVNEILFEYFFKQVKYMNKKEFKQHLINLNIIEGEKMKNKLSQFFIEYMKNKKCKTFNQGGVDLSNNDPNDNWSTLNPFRDSTMLSDNVIEFINEKNLSGIKSSMDLVEEQSDKATKEQRELNTIKGDE
jgi:hypothetical protein